MRGFIRGSCTANGGRSRAAKASSTGCETRDWMRYATAGGHNANTLFLCSRHGAQGLMPQMTQTVTDSEPEKTRAVSFCCFYFSYLGRLTPTQRNPAQPSVNWMIHRCGSAFSSSCLQNHVNTCTARAPTRLVVCNRSRPSFRTLHTYPPSHHQAVPDGKASPRKTDRKTGFSYVCFVGASNSFDVASSSGTKEKKNLDKGGGLSIFHKCVCR